LRAGVRTQAIPAASCAIAATIIGAQHIGPIAPSAKPIILTP
jgi:hypothetical protein